MPNNLTKRQLDIFNYIKQAIIENGYPPSVREIGEAVGLSSSSTVHGHLSQLEKKGYIRRDPSKPRAIEVIDKEELSINFSNIVNVPVVGQVAAGIPILAEENIEETFPLPKNLVKFDKVFMLKVKGESMIKAGIFNGDYVIVRKQSTADNGEIVVALLDNEATVKRFYLENDCIRLEAENDAFSPIITTNAHIIGKVIGLFRKM